MSTIAILGGGISGLSAAYYLSKACHPKIAKIVLLEGSKSLGGWIQSTKYEDGSVFEHGPRSLRGVGKAGVNTLLMIEELGLTGDLLPVPGSHAASRSRFIYVGGQLCPLPNGFGALLRRHAPFSKSLVALGWKEPFRKSVKVKDESVHSFFQRRLGDEIARYAADPLCRGIYSGDSKQLSMKSCFPTPFGAEQKHGSIVRGMLMLPKDRGPVESELVRRYKQEKWSMWSFTDGLIQLPRALNAHLQGSPTVQLVTDSPCTGLDWQNDKIKVKFEGGEHLVDHVISSIPSQNLASLMGSNHAGLAEHLSSIHAVSCGVVNLQYENVQLPVQGFGHLVPSSESSKVLGVVYDSCVFDKHNSQERPSIRLTCMMGGAWFRELFGEPDSCDVGHLAEVAMAAVRDQLHITAEPCRVISKVQKNCIPQYVVGHADTLDDLDTYISEQQLALSLVGASYRGASVNECIYNSRLEVERLLTQL